MSPHVNVLPNAIVGVGRHRLVEVAPRKRCDHPQHLPTGKSHFTSAVKGSLGKGSRSKPGDYVDLRAEMDVLALISNCPQMNNPVNDYNPTPVRAIVYQP